MNRAKSEEMRLRTPQGRYDGVDAGPMIRRGPTGGSNWGLEPRPEGSLSGFHPARRSPYCSKKCIIPMMIGSSFGKDYVLC